MELRIKQHGRYTYVCGIGGKPQGLTDHMRRKAEDLARVTPRIEIGYYDLELVQGQTIIDTELTIK